jgi:RNA polymerase sigma factor (sigma-70 family)
MPRLPLEQVLRHIRRWSAAGDSPALSDGELLARFAEHQDENAFESLLQRHGPLVLRVCRSVLADAHDAEDAFQATFLVLIRRAAGLEKRPYLGAWLHEVASRTARQARLLGLRRKAREHRATRTLSENARVPTHDVRPVLDEELGRLPEKYRAPLILCYLQGKTNAEAADQLGWTRGTIAGRLARARDLLRSRLERRGLALSTTALASALAPEAGAALPEALVTSTLHMASLVSAGSLATAHGTAVVALTEGVLRSMSLGKLRFVVALLTVLVMGSTVLLAHALMRSPDAVDDRPASATVMGADARSWPMFGGRPGRNMVNLIDRHVPTDWAAAWKETARGKVLDSVHSRNIKWAAHLGSRAYGGPVVVGGQVYVGTNNENPRDPAIKGDRGILMCFHANNGAFLWQAVHDKLPAGTVNDWPKEGVVSTPTVEDERVYYVSNRCELVCAAARPRDGGSAAQILWKLDMMATLGVFPHNMSACAPLVVGDLVFVVTANGVGEAHVKVEAPHAPSFIAVNKWTGRVVWQDASPGANIMHGQWSNPTYAYVRDQPMVIFPGGDGWLRAFEPGTGKLLWQFDGNPKAAVYQLGGRGDRSDFIATPVVHENKLYIAMGQDPEHYEGVGHLWCIDLERAVERGRKNVACDVSPVNDNFDPNAAVNRASALAWHFGGKQAPPVGRDYLFGRTLSTCAVHDGLVYAAELGGYLHCLDARTGKSYWVHDLKAAVWGSPYWVDGKVYMATEDGDVWIFAHGKEKAEPTKIEMEQPIRSTPTVVDGVLYLMTENYLYAISTR